MLGRPPRYLRRLAWLCVLGACALTAPAARADVAWPGNPFAPTSVWNAPVASRPALTPDSDALVHTLAAQVREQGHSWINTWDYSVPVYVVGRRQRAVHVTLDDANAPLQRAFDAVPVPRNARAALGSDEHMTVWQPATNRLWDFWHMHRTGGGWHARWGGEMNDVSRNPGYFANAGSDQNWGATATGLPLLGGLITFADLRHHAINHALALAIPDTEARTWVWPAQRTDGNVEGATGIAIPEGTHLRLDPHVDVARLPLSPLGKMIARAAQRYGIVVRDKGGAVTFFGQAPTSSRSPWTAALGGHSPSQELQGFPWSRLQVLRSSSSCCWAPR